MKRFVIFAAILFALLIAGRFVVWPRVNPAGSDTDGALTLYGNVEIRQVELAFRVSGRLEAVNFEEGDAISAGDEIASLDTAPLRDAVTQARAEASVRQAELARLKAGSRSQEIDRARARVEELEATVLAAQQVLTGRQTCSNKGLRPSKSLIQHAPRSTLRKSDLLPGKRNWHSCKSGRALKRSLQGVAGLRRPKHLLHKLN